MCPALQLTSGRFGRVAPADTHHINTSTHRNTNKTKPQDKKNMAPGHPSGMKTVGGNTSLGGKGGKGLGLGKTGAKRHR